jgi:hypothetical protein
MINVSEVLLKMKKKFTSILAFLLLNCASPLVAQQPPLSLKEKFTNAQAGDFVVTAQDGNYSLLFIRSLSPQTLLLEEISVPSQHINLAKTDWKKWVKEKAPGHTSWTLYEIDSSTGKLIECFSYSKNGWLYLDQSEQFLTRLLSLPLLPVLSSERKKIGIQPTQEQDLRALWNPPLVVEGKKVSKPSFEVLKTKWPDDGSRLSLCTIELYFSKEHPSFPFPYWLEVKSPHYAFKIRTIDSGHHLMSSMQGVMPRRPPQIVGLTQKGEKSWKLVIRTPSYFQEMNLFAIDEDKTTFPIAFSTKTGSKNEEFIFEIPCSELKRVLKSGQRYQWILTPKAGNDVYVKSDETFILQ